MRRHILSAEEHLALGIQKASSWTEEDPLYQSPLTCDKCSLDNEQCYIPPLRIGDVKDYYTVFARCDGCRTQQHVCNIFTRRGKHQWKFTAASGTFSLVRLPQHIIKQRERITRNAKNFRERQGVVHRKRKRSKPVAQYNAPQSDRPKSLLNKQTSKYSLRRRKQSPSPSASESDSDSDWTAACTPQPLDSHSQPDDAESPRESHNDPASPNAGSVDEEMSGELDSYHALVDDNGHSSRAPQLPDTATRSNPTQDWERQPYAGLSTEDLVTLLVRRDEQLKENDNIAQALMQKLHTIAQLGSQISQAATV